MASELVLAIPMCSRKLLPGFVKLCAWPPYLTLHVILHKFQGPGERGYHIFYELMSGASAPLSERLGFSKCSSFHYLKDGQDCQIEGRSDRDEFKVTKDCLTRIGITEETQEDIFTLIASVLHLGS